MYIYSVYAHHSQSRFSEMEGSLRLEGNLTVTRQVVEIATRAIFVSFTHIMIARWLLNEVSINTMGRPYFSTGEQLKYLQNKDAMSMTKTTQVHVSMWCIHIEDTLMLHYTDEMHQGWMYTLQTLGCCTTQMHCGWSGMDECVCSTFVRNGYCNKLITDINRIEHYPIKMSKTNF